MGAGSCRNGFSLGLVLFHLRSSAWVCGVGGKRETCFGIVPGFACGFAVLGKNSLLVAFQRVVLIDVGSASLDVLVERELVSYHMPSQSRHTCSSGSASFLQLLWFCA